MPRLPGTRTAQIADVGIELLSERGMRGLTHRAADSTLGLPPGSTSYYFRTRAALVGAVVARLAELDAADAALAQPAAGQITGTGQLAEALEYLLNTLLTTGRTRTRARFHLATEALHNNEVRDALTRHGEQFRAATSRMLAALGFPDPPRQGRALVAICDGLAFESVTRNPPAPTREQIRATLAEVLDGMRASPPPPATGSPD
jgi:AcrR family transcriptional regulator